MFKYTPHPDILRKYDNIQNNGKRPAHEHCRLAMGICSIQVYFQVGDFWKHYKGVNHYSETKLKMVPVNGALISSEYFMETKV